MKEFINFKSQRELGEILTDTFKFLRLEYKELFKALVRNAAVPFIILIAIAGYYATVSAGISFMGNGLFNFANIFLPLAGLLLAALFYYAILYGTILTYIKMYINNQGIVDQDELKNEVRNKLGKLTGLGFLSAVIVFFGLAMCFLPGIYLAVPISLAWALLIFQDKSVGDSISDSFKFIKGEWWMTFATLFVLGLILYIANVVFSLPVIIYSLGKAFADPGQISQGDLSSLFDWVYLTLNVLSSAVQYILAGIYPITIAFVFYNLNEKNNQTGTFETIESIGSDL